MTVSVSVGEAASQFSELFQRVRQGEEIIILENGHELARVVPSLSTKAPRIPGIDEGKIIFAPDFEVPLPEEILQGFEGIGLE
jgi:prevent-host-death family protein